MYITYIKKEKVYNNCDIREESEKYELIKNKVNNEHDKTFRTIFNNKGEVSKLIKDIFNVQVLEKDLEKYNSSFIDMNLNNQESDIIYKLKNKNIFFLIEHQTKIDYTMPFRILKYEVLIMENAIDRKKYGQKNYKLPIVYPIVLYTGNRRWNAGTYISDIQEGLDNIEEIQFAKFNIVDVNEYSEEQLLESKSFYTKAMLIEKTKTVTDTVNYLEKIAEIINNDKQNYPIETKEMFRNILNKIIRIKIGENETNKILENLDKESGDVAMMAVFEMIQKENREIFMNGRKQGKVEGKIEGIKEIAKKLLNKNLSKKEISEITGLRDDEIEELK